MPSNKKPKKKYRPKYQEGQLPVVFRHSQDADLNLKFIPHDEIEKFRHGQADETALNSLKFRLNWGYVMAGEYFDTPEARKCMEDSLSAIRSVSERVGRTGKYGCTQPEFEAICAGLDVTDDMQSQTTRRQQRDAAYVVHAINLLKRESND